MEWLLDEVWCTLRTKPKKVVGHLWWKKEVEVEEDSDVQDITAEEIK